MSDPFAGQIDSMFCKYGLFSSRHPVLMIVLSAVMILSCCYPLLNLPIPGSEPQQYFTSLEDFVYNPQTDSTSLHGEFKQRPDLPEWLLDERRIAYVQQFIVKFSLDSQSDIQVTSGSKLKAQLHVAFSLMDEIRNFALEKNLTISKSCFQVNDTVIKPKKRIKNVFPEDGCLLISPTAFWKNKRELFLHDINVLETVNQFDSKTLRAPPSIKELLFGLPAKQSGLQSKSERISFAVTLVLKRYNPKVITSLQNKLYSLYSSPMLEPHHHVCAVEVHSKSGTKCSNISQVVTHIKYKPQLRINNLIPLLSTYFIIGCYVYFSVRKINFVKSKIGMAFSAVVSVMASLMMAVGLCSLIGLTPTLNGGHTFPYLVSIIGLENILVITKSVVATNPHLNVEQRMSIGLGRESHSIIKNLLLEFGIIGLGYLSFNPEIQEFCAFAFVGVFSDFFVNMMFFVTVLSIDIRRLDISEEPYPDESQQAETDDSSMRGGLKLRSRIKRRASRPKIEPLNSMETGGKVQTILKVPKRLRVIFFFADARMIQRGLMVSIVIWISFLAYRDPASLLKDEKQRSRDHICHTHFNLEAISVAEEMHNNINSDPNTIVWSFKDVLSFHHLSFRHWPTLFAYYNVTLAEQFISVLPSILLPINVTQADLERISETLMSKSDRSQPKVEAVNPIESLHLPFPKYFWTGGDHMTGLDYYLTLVMGAVSGMFMVFILNIMYHCVCSRNYAYVRKPSSSSENGTCSFSSGDSIPLILSGHKQLVDSVYVEGVTITSADLSGELRMWDIHSGECTAVIKRSKEFCPNQENRFNYDMLQINKVPGNSKLSSSIWSLTSSGKYIIVGCSDGSVEVWDCVSGDLQCCFEKHAGGVVGLASEEHRIVAARISGRLDFFSLENHVPEHKTKSGTSSHLLDSSYTSVVSLQLLNSVRSAHQQPISAFEMCMQRVLTGSSDHTLKLFDFHDARCHFSMYGHNGPITVLYMDKQAPAGAVSGSTDSTVRLWDLLSGMCLHTLKGHKAAIRSAQCSMTHIVSTAQDNKLCIWARGNGDLLQVVKLDSNCYNAMSLLGQNFCVTGGKGFIYLWDIRSGELLRNVALSCSSLVRPAVQQIHISSDFCVVCISGHEILVVKFPAVLEMD